MATPKEDEGGIWEYKFGTLLDTLVGSARGTRSAWYGSGNGAGAVGAAGSFTDPGKLSLRAHVTAEGSIVYCSHSQMLFPVTVA